MRWVVEGPAIFDRRFRDVDGIDQTIRLAYGAVVIVVVWHIFGVGGIMSHLVGEECRWVRRSDDRRWWRLFLDLEFRHGLTRQKTLTIGLDQQLLDYLSGNK